METFDGTALIVYAAIFVIGLLILGVTISTAVQVRKRNAYMRITIDMLGKIALKQGADEGEVKHLVSKAYAL